MGFILKFFLFIFIFIWVLRTFKNYIAAFFIKAIAKKVVNQMDKQNQAYQRNYTGPFQESVYQDDKIHVTSEKTQTPRKQPPKAVDFAEDVEFEEL